MMNTKLISFCACIALANAGLLPSARHEDGDADAQSHASYSFSYEVQDAETGDYKSQSETRDGDNVQGQYSLYDADGYQRIVEYSVNGESGFNAVVRREPLNAANVPTAEPIRAVPAVVAPAPTSPPPPPPPPAPIATAAPIRREEQQQQQQQHQPLIKAITQPTATFLTPTVLHHAPAATHTLIHAAPTVHLSPATAHYVHAAPATTTTLLRTAPAVITHHHHAPAAHVVKTTSFTSPHIKYVF